MSGKNSMQSLKSFLATAILVTAGTALPGCGQSESLPKYTVYPVSGSVLLADGKPLTTGSVYFVPKGDLPVTPVGEIKPDGTFSLITGGSGEGAPAGDYKVRIEAIELKRSAKSKKPAIPTKYNDEDSSGLVFTVRSEPTHLEAIRLK
jgi:hypothetical protein